MTASALLDAIVTALRRADIPFMLTGSFAAAVHGVGRATMDIDFVIDPTSAALESFVQDMLASDRYVSPEAAREALAARLSFNVVDVESSWKIDLMIRRDRPFSVEEFGRRTEVVLGSVRLPVATIEDLVLAKLEWAQMGGSARQLDDVRALLRLAGPSLDRTYVARWIGALGLEAQSRAVGLGDVL
jgi:hypothetical protein